MFSAFQRVHHLSGGNIFRIILCIIFLVSQRPLNQALHVSQYFLFFALVLLHIKHCQGCFFLCRVHLQCDQGWSALDAYGAFLCCNGKGSIEGGNCRQSNLILFAYAYSIHAVVP